MSRVLSKRWTTRGDVVLNKIYFRFHHVMPGIKLASEILLRQLSIEFETCPSLFLFLFTPITAALIKHLMASGFQKLEEVVPGVPY